MMKISFEKYVDDLAVAAAKSEKPTIMLLTCMDYRYGERILKLMDQRGLRRKYDVFTLGGAAAGSNQNAQWRQTFIDHVKTALTIGHPIDTIAVLEHRDCGAYKHFFHLDWETTTPNDELAKHQEQVDLFITDMKLALIKEIPHLKIDAFLMTREDDDTLHLESPSY